MTNKLVIIALFSLLFLHSCKEEKTRVDLVVYNAIIYTVNDSMPNASAFAIDDGEFVAVGETENIKSIYQGESEIDIKGQCVFPGFNDGHCHFYGLGLKMLDFVDLKGTLSFDEVITRLKTFHIKDSAEWISGFGWNQNNWDIKEFPDNKIIDSLFPNTPVLLTRIDGHAVLANSEALRRGEIDITTSIEGGHIEKQGNKLTGILLDKAADHLKSLVIVPHERKIEALIKAQNACFSVGLTSLADAGQKTEIINLIDSMQSSGDINIRLNCMVATEYGDYSDYLSKGIKQSDYLSVNTLKMYADGALGSRGAKLLLPYSDDTLNSGILVENELFIRNVCKEAYDNGFQVSTHAIGDSAVRLILNIYGDILKEKNDRRWRIEHSQVVHPDDFELFGKYSIIPSVQTSHATSDMYWAAERLGNDRVKGAYAYKDMLNQNGWIINGTDFPVEDISPLNTFYSAVSRKDKKGYPDNGFQKRNGLSRDEALKSITIWPARGTFDENRKGSIVIGKLADFVILNKDIMTIQEQDLPEVKVIKTFINGKQVFSE